ncbi:MAG: TRAP transporter small permease subunit [Rhodobacteraceae bacterium]|nr:TRAP transporter small permease subunit [Paracoccaceae bacterium]
MRAISDILNRLSWGLNRVALIGAALAVAVMLAAAGWQVIARYLLHQPPVWTEELARFSMVWGGLLGASCAYRYRLDPTLFPNALKAAGAKGLAFTLARSFGVMCFVLPILWFSFFGLNANPARGYIARLAGRQTETMDLPMVVFGIAIPLAFTLILIHVLADLVRAVADLRTAK